MIYLTSFFGAGDGPRYSIARWAPRGFLGDATTLTWLGARAPDGSPLRQLPPGVFRERYLAYLHGRRQQLRAWLATLPQDEDLCLCCWCTLARQRPHKKLYCHRILVGRMIESVRPDIEVVYLDGAETSIWE